MFLFQLPFVNLVLVILVTILFLCLMASIMNVQQIVITLEIYGVKNIVGIPFGYRGFSDEELTEVPVISFSPPC